MSRGLWIHKFVDGENLPPDMDAVREVPERRRTSRDAHRTMRLVTMGRVFRHV